jgi:hypothetical protein
MTFRIRRLSTWLWWTSGVLALVLPAVVLLAVLKGWFDPATLAARFPALPAATPVSSAQAALVAALGLLSTLPMVVACLAMRRLFGRYRQGEILTDACAAEILRIGAALLAVALATVLIPALQLLTLSWFSPAGRILAIGLDGGTLGFVLAGGLLTVIGWVMGEASRLREENEGFV